MRRTIVRVGLDESGLKHVAVCQSGRGCTWKSAAHVVKAGAVEEAKWHRSWHRECRLLAEESTRHGYFRSDQTHAWVPCPRCRHHVTTAFRAGVKDREIVKALHDAVEEHLLARDECTGRSG